MIRQSSAPRAETTVRCLHAEAKLAETARELRRARAQAARGDPWWRARLERYDRGDTLIVALTARVVIEHAGGGQNAVSCYCHEAVWVDRETTPRVLTDQLRELARRDFATVAPALRNRGIQLNASQEQIAVELALDPAITAQLGAPSHRW